MIFTLSALIPEDFDWANIFIPIVWFCVIVLTLVIESQTADLVSVWFAPGAFVALILSFCSVEFWIQLAVFICVTVLGMIISFTVLRPLLKKRYRTELTNLDALAGKSVQVVEAINNEIPTGVVKVHGQLWTARMEDFYSTAAQGEWVTIVRVEGSKVICRNKD